MSTNLIRTKHWNLFCATAILAFTLSGCSMKLAFAENILAKNRENLAKLRMGMSREEVISIMGNQTINTIDEVIITSPYRVETLKDVNNENLEILFFYTDEKRDARKVSDDELTPVVLKNGKVDGWGRTYLADIAPSYNLRFRP